MYNFAVLLFIRVWLSLFLGSLLIGVAHAETLHEAVSRSISNSDARQIAIASIKAQNKKVAISQNDRGFRIELQGELAAEQYDDTTREGLPGNGDTQFARKLSVTATYPLLDGLRSLNLLYREATLLDVEIIRLSDATETIALNAVQAYIDVYRRQKIVEISEQNIDVHANIAAQVAQQVDAGKLSEPDRFQANDKVLLARLALADAKASLEEAISNYHFVIGTSPKGRLSLTSRVKLPRNRTDAEEQAVRNSYLLKIAQKDTDAVTYQGMIDAAQWQPRVDAFIRGGIEEDIEGVPGNQTGISAGLRLNWTLYKGGTKADTIARNRDLQMRAHYRMKQVEDEVRKLARNSWNAYTAAIERKSLLDKSAANQENIVNAFRREFEAAKRPLLEVLDSERAAFNIRVRQANAEAAVIYQTYRILAAQNMIGAHFGLSPYGRSLNADFESRVKVSPRGDFDISAPNLE